MIGIAVVRYPRETEFLIKSLADLFMDTPLFNAHTTVHSLTCAADRLDCRSSACAAVTAADSSIRDAEIDRPQMCTVACGVRGDACRSLPGVRACVPCSGSTAAH